ncbi:MAG: T9SS type A sorting domain-containing protein [Bacteroidetes bacterium]|nr:T9SS type A sorting domain-containing protein [Bacteroidota bacterium]
MWYLNSDATPTGGQYDLKLFFNGFNGLSDNAFGILRRPDASANAAEWVVPAGSILPDANQPGRTVSSGFARRNNISTFSQLGIGMSAVPLPVVLLNFYGNKKDKNVVLQWNTGDETNGNHFELYKGVQPASLQYLDKVNASGTGGTHSYSYTDNNPMKGLSYYQLKLVDNNGAYKLSSVVKINIDATGILSVFPNPVTNHTVLVTYQGTRVKSVQLISADGKQIPCSFNELYNGQVKVSIPTSVAKGVYTLQLTTDITANSAVIVVSQ